GNVMAWGGDGEGFPGLWRREPRSKLSRLSRDLREITDRYRPRLDFAVVATELPRLKARIFRGGEVDWRHLAASCAIPMVIAPVRVDGRLYADGGLFNPLPGGGAGGVGASRDLALRAPPWIPSWCVKTAR